MNIPGVSRAVWISWIGWTLAAAWAEDWPAHQHDASRSGRTGEMLSAAQLAEQWVYRAAQPPQPAWDAPAKWDAYAGLHGLKSMRNYDPVLHVTVVGQSVFFGSSVDSAVHCLDSRTGREKWSFHTDGPVRIAPMGWEGRLYFGADDGYAYCLDAAQGRLLWKFSPAPDYRRVLQDGQFISFWPCRTGVLVDGGTAYFAAGMLPWKESYLCALDAKTGRVEGPGRFVRKLDSVTLEGALLVSSDKIICPQGRVAPLLFNRNNGAPLGSLDGGGGCFVLLTDDARILHGPGNKDGWIQESNATNRSKIATFNGGTALVVRGNTAYLLTETALAALDRQTRQTLWRQTNSCSLALIMAGDVLFAGGTDEVRAFDARDGRLLWKGAVSGRAYGLAAADQALFVSTEEGAIHCFRAAQMATPARPTVTAAEEDQAPATGRLELVLGPCLQFIDAERAKVWWQTAQPMPTRIEWGRDGERLGRYEDTTERTQHTALLTGLRRNRQHYYVIGGIQDGHPAVTEKFDCDTAFNYTLPPVPEGPSHYPADEQAPLYSQMAADMLNQSGVRQGVCLVLGCGEGRLAYELVRQSDLRVIGVEVDPDKVGRARAALQRAGVLGSRVQVLPVSSLSALPFPDLFANLIVSERLAMTGEFPASPADVARCLRPHGGVALLGPSTGGSESWRSRLNTWQAGWRPAPAFTSGMQGLWFKIVRGALPGAADWSHEYGTAANAAYAGETLQGARSTADLDVLWLGRPGPRVQADRNGRKPSPLAAHGRLFMQGLQRIIALDAFNGTILWTRELPRFQRFNMPRDCSNWCADSDSVYAAIDDHCWQFEAASGEVKHFYPVLPGTRSGWKYDWSYLSIQGQQLIGSASKQGSAFTNFWGGSDAGWYDATYGPATDKVCSENLFSLDRDSGVLRWVYRGGIILNSTLTIGADRIYFLESRHPAVKSASSHRLGLPELWQDLHLVALELSSGRMLWEQPVKPAAGDTVVYLAYGEDTLVLVSSGDKRYHVYAYAASGGRSLWRDTFAWTKDNHGGHMSRPAIVEGRVFVRPNAYELRTGRRLAPAVPGGGCGTYAATAQTLVFRNSNVTVWDIEKGLTTSWERLRPDCWLSTVPALGLLLSPEAGGGCSCGAWMETSIVFAPR